MTHGELAFHKYCEMIDGVSANDIKRVADKVFSGKPTLLVTGDAINLVPNLTDVSR